jgi:serine/threonine-protein kinase RIM15
MAEPVAQEMLVPPAVANLRESERSPGGQPGRMERSLSQDIREEREELKHAAELDGRIRWVSPTWRDVIGTSPESVVGKQIGEILVDDATAFTQGIESLQKDDSRSQIIRFSAVMGPSSILEPTSTRSRVGEDGVEIEERIINVEAQGIMVYNRSSGGESHV